MSPPQPGTEFRRLGPRIAALFLEHPDSLPARLRPHSPCLKPAQASASSTGAPDQSGLFYCCCAPQLPALGFGGPPPPPAPHAPPSSTRDAGALGLFPLPRAPYLTTSPSFSHHLRTSGPLSESSAVPPSPRRAGLEAGRLAAASQLSQRRVPSRCAPDAAHSRGPVARRCQTLNEPLARSIVAP